MRSRTDPTVFWWMSTTSARRKSLRKIIPARDGLVATVPATVGAGSLSIARPGEQAGRADPALRRPFGRGAARRLTHPRRAEARRRAGEPREGHGGPGLARTALGDDRGGADRGGREGQGADVDVDLRVGLAGQRVDDLGVLQLRLLPGVG